MTNYSPTLLSYSVTPDAVSYTEDPSAPSTVELMIAVNNSTGQNVDCSRLVFTLPVGTGAGDLTADPSAINAVPALGTSWSIQSDGTGNFIALPQAPVTGLNAGDSIAFSLSGIQVNDWAGLVEITIREETNAPRQTQLGVSKVPPGLAITSFNANPIQVAPGQPSTLAWTTTGAQSVTLFWPNQSIPVPPDGQEVVTPQQTTTYTLVATGDSSVSQQITVTVLG